jgi:hypothetical protein
LVIPLSATSKTCAHSRFLARRHEPKFRTRGRELAENRSFVDATLVILPVAQNIP